MTLDEIEAACINMPLGTMEFVVDHDLAQGELAALTYRITRKLIDGTHNGKHIILSRSDREITATLNP